MSYGGLIGSLLLGGTQLISYIMVRVLMWLNGKYPLNYYRFLEYCVEHQLLRRVGSGYIFSHRYLQEYFADQYKQHYS